MAASTSSWILLLLALLICTFIATVSAGNEIYENRGIKSVNGDKRPFFVGSRYGRSQSDLTNMDNNGKPNNMARIVPRNDRFFFGSRYGKRSLPAVVVDEDQSQVLSCFFTGITNLYRCVEKIDLQLNTDDDK